MPNGGSDCCGTCWFNAKNNGQAGYARMEDAGENRCEIRDLPVQNAFYTYCANHPHHNPDRIRLPIGPVYCLDEEHHPGGLVAGPRRVLAESPDTEEIRRALIDLLEMIPETPLPEYPSATQRDAEVIRQLGHWRERRAASGLRRILSFDPDAHTTHLKSGFSDEVLIPSSKAPYRQDRRRLLGLALEALARILGDEALADIERVYRSALQQPSRLARLAGSQEDPDAVQRRWAVLALAQCPAGHVNPLLAEMLQDRDPMVASQAKKLLGQS